MTMFSALRILLLIGAAYLATACQTVQERTWDLPAGVKTMTVNGYPMAYTERGSGPTLVFVHGSLNDYRYWAPQLEALSAQRRVVSPSLRHYYPEPWNGKGEFSLTMHARDLAAFIEGLGPGPVDLVGWSRGGNVALVMARTRPELIRTLVLMDPGLSEFLPPPANAAQGEDPRITRMKATQAYFEKNDIEGGLRFFFDSVNGPGSWAGLTEPLRQGRRENAWTLVGQLGDVETITCEDIAKLRMPMLVMTGERSPKTFSLILDRIQQCNPAVQRYVVPRAVHQMSQANPADSNGELARFLAGR